MIRNPTPIPVEYSTSYIRENLVFKAKSEPHIEEREIITPTEMSVMKNDGSMHPIPLSEVSFNGAMIRLLKAQRLGFLGNKNQTYSTSIHV